MAGVVLFGVHRLKGFALSDAVAFGGLWGAVAAAVFTAAGYVRYRRSPACMLPRNTPK